MNTKTIINKDSKKLQNVNIYRILFWILMVTGILVRIIQFGAIPGDINQDEAFSGYDAYSLLHYGIDSAGYTFPIYMTTWGSGMSALNTYLIIPFMAIFGPKTWVIRLPQVIIACLTLWVVYLLMKRLFHEKIALCALFLLVISPWHIAMSRWGIDANLAPGFLIFGLYFFVRGLENSKFFLLSSLMYGLSLYCYATIWVIVPIIICAQYLYGFWTKKIKFDRYLVLSVLLLGILALPLFLFLLVNWDIIAEITLPFLSIPKLVHMRDSEFSLSDLPTKATRLWHIIKIQEDGIPMNGTSQYGIAYMGSLSFFVLGIFYCIKTTLEKLFQKKFAPEFLLLIQVGGGILLGLLIYTNINRNNILFIPMIIVAALGMYYLFSLIDLRYLLLPILFYSTLFCCFVHYYFTDYSDEMDYYFCRGLESAVTEATSYDGTIYYSRGLEHSRILFYSQLPAEEFIDTVEYYIYPSPYLEAKSFGRFTCDLDANTPDINITYILSQQYDLAPYKEMGFTLTTHGQYTVAHHPDNPN